MRIAVGMVLLVDLFIRSLSIKAFFTDEGVLPIAILKNYNWNPYYFSFHTLNGDLWWQITLFALNALCIVLLIKGYRARLFTFICWVFITSLQNRNPFILQGGDDLLRLILLWGIFLPWGERYAGKTSSFYANSYFSYANLGYIFLVCSVYFFSALLKTHAEWHSEGTALYYALSLEQLRLPLGTLLYHFPLVMKGLTRMVYYLELVAPVLIILPFINYRVRLVGIIAIALLHIGIAGTLYVGLFYIIGLVTLIGLLPEALMNKYEAKFIRTVIIVKEKSMPTGSFIVETFLALKNGFIILIICYCLLLNLGNVKKFPYVLDPQLIKFGNTLRLEQSWGMFSPSVYKDDGFYVYSGYTSTGKYIDIKRHGQPISFNKPANIVSEFESDRWRKFGENYLFNNNNYMRPYFCKYLLRNWNNKHPENHISDLTIFFMKEESLPDYKTKPLEKTALCNCQDK
ncbi:MAG: hypothetical protein V4506_14835 [Bacteroidota bacterium]